MEPVFKNPLLQKQFENRGFVILPALLNSTIVESLLSVFTKFQSQVQGPFHTTHFSKDVDYKKQVHDTIVKTVFPQIVPYLEDIVPLFGNFMTKNADPQVAMNLHADWTYVNEGEFCSAALWSPLVKVNAENGCLGIIEYSHKVTNTIRGPRIRQSSFENDQSWEGKYGKLLPMNAGDAIIYNHKLLHYSPPNKTSKVRPALNLSMAPANASWIHYCIPEGFNEIEMYQVTDPDFFIHYNNFQRPETGTLIKTLPADSVKWIDSRMNVLWKVRMLSRIKEWIN